MSRTAGLPFAPCNHGCGCSAYGVAVKLQTVGRVHLTRDDGQGIDEVALQPLPLAVLTYLAVGGPRDRDHLCDLFWPNGKNRLNSLSTTLNRIRAEVPGGVWVRGNSLVGIDVSTDLADLRDAVDRSDFDSVSRLYDAPFLESLRLRRRSEEFEEWVLAERAALAATVELALVAHGSGLYDAGDYHAAAQAVENAWGIAIRDGFPSSAHFEVYHQILATAGRPAAGVVRSMAEEIGIDLAPIRPTNFGSSAEVVPATAPDLRSASVEQDAVGDAQRIDHVASGAAPLFGCEDELDAIASSVAERHLTTIVGLGGSGKTRLAAEFFGRADTAKQYPHRHWVNLQDVVDGDLVGPAIATSLGQRFDNVSALADALPDDEPVLIVLDNFEHVLASARIADELVDTNQAIRILATSRVPLHVEAESLVRLTGLDTADQQADSPAERLFLSSARRAGVGDDRLSDAHRAVIRDICRSVGGNPLALEIVGGWTQVLTPAEILAALAVDLELLGSPMVDAVRPMDAVLEQSWATLGEAEQNTLMLLATFPSGLLMSEALKLADLSVTSIGRLVQHSLARLEVEGRISLHPLIAAHASAELEKRADLHRAFLRVRSSWCQAFATVQRPNASMKHGLDGEIGTFAAAWLHDAQLGSWDLHRVTLAPLREFFNESGRTSEARSLFTALVDALRSEAKPPRDLLPAALEAVGWFEMLAGELSQARTRLDEALALSSPEDSRTQAQIRRSRGVVRLSVGEIVEATADLEAGLTLLDGKADSLTASLQYDLAQAHRYSGDRGEAIRSARLALQASRATKNWSVMTTSYLLLADIEVETDPERAIVLLNEGWAIAQEASLDNLAIYFPLVLGLAHLSRREAETAERYFTDGIEAANGVRQLATVCANHIGRAESRLLQEQTPDAIDDLRTGLRMALNTGSATYLMWAAVVCCRASAAMEAPSSHAKELLLLVLGHPAADQDGRNKAVAALRDLFDETAESHAAASGDLDDVSLDEIAERSLQLIAAG